MVNSTKSDFRQNRKTKGSIENRARASKIDASTLYETCSEQLSPFGGLLATIKFLDLLGLEQLFDSAYQVPARNPKLGHYKMVIGILMLLFIGFNRIWHFTYIRVDAMLCGFFRLARLPFASTFWRYLANPLNPMKIGETCRTGHPTGGVPAHALLVCVRIFVAIFISVCLFFNQSLNLCHLFY